MSNMINVGTARAAWFARIHKGLTTRSSELPMSVCAEIVLFAAAAQPENSSCQLPSSI